MTNMLTKLLEIKPDLFIKNTRRYKSYFSETSVHSICSRLRKWLLLQETLKDDLTEKDIHILTKELKSRAQNFFKIR